MLIRFYDSVILAYPRLVLLLILVMVGFLGFQGKDLIIDASAETLILEDDKDLQFTRLINSRYGIGDFLIVTYTPHGDLLSKKSLMDLRQLRDDLEQLEGVESVVSMLDVPLLESPIRPIKEVLRNSLTLESPSVDLKLARQELSTSPIYRNMLVSPDFKTTALQVNLPIDKVYRDLLLQRDFFKEKKKAGPLTSEELLKDQEIREAFKAQRGKTREAQHLMILNIRAVLEKYRQESQLFLGGVSMVADDMISFVKNDLRVFGAGVLFFLVTTLLVIFRQLRWILLPLICVVCSAVSMIGVLGLFGWEVTVISSNFISLQLIMTMAFTIHLIVRYREQLHKNPEIPQRELVLNTVGFMAQPCFFSALTTAAGFGSLVISNILPIMNFGLMMSVGIAVSLVLTFLIFPCVVSLLEKKQPNTSFETHFPLTKSFARFTQFYGKTIFSISGILLIISVAGISFLVVENSFINYFKESTEIYRGMKLIDRELGGTTPFDVVVDLNDSEAPSLSIVPVDPETLQEEGSGEGFGAFEEEFEEGEDEAKYWFTSDKMEKVLRIHNYLDDLPETGKVFSLGTMLKVGKKLNQGKPLDNFDLALIYSELPEKFREMVLKPYVSVEHNQVRFSVRVRDSEENLRRNELLKKIESDLTQQLGLKKENVHLSGLLVLYNNMLQSLFRSQILTLGAVVVVLFIMFMVLFRSLILSAIAILPNLLSIGVVLGFMGWMGIPLDMMTITIAAISVGIAVDNTIHYIHRFKREFQLDRNYVYTMHRCHGSIGYAMYYTSLTIIIGFSILVFSNFVPTIYFGLLTGLAMVIALIAALTLLPYLIIWVKPLGSEGLKTAVS